jgi:hypothetical protein
MRFMQGIAVVLLAGSLHAEEPCDCAGRFDRIVEKVRADYIGYALGVKTARQRATFDALVVSLHEKAAHSSNEECVFVARELTDSMHDGHLFVLEGPEVSEAEAKTLADTAEVVERSESSIRAYLVTNAGKLDPIEGIWYSSEGYRTGIIRDEKPGRRDFVAVMLTPNVPAWRAGQVKAEFSRIAADTYSAVLYVDDHSARHPIIAVPGGPPRAGARIYKGLLLEMAPRAWGKEFPLAKRQEGLLDPKDPHAPAFRALDRDAVLLSIPSHSPEHRSRLEALVKEHHEEIVRATTLIIDLRGNEGGSAQTTDILNPFIYTGRKRDRNRAQAAGDYPVVLSSPDNITYFGQMMSQGWIPKHLVERMTASPGKVIPFSDTVQSPWSSAEKQEIANPAAHNVALILDRGIVSAGGAFILQAMRSPKVTLFGENSAGVIDYQNVTRLRIGCPSQRLLLGYPTMAGAASLPKGGINGIGIAPDVRIPASAEDPYKFIIAYYAKKGAR